MASAEIVDRRGRKLPDDHPLVKVQDQLPEQGDCISDVDPKILEELVAYHGMEEPPDTEVDPEELV